MKFVLFATILCFITLCVTIIENRRYRFLPENVTLYLFTWKNPKEPDVVNIRRSKLASYTNYINKKDNYFVIHDSYENYTSTGVGDYVKDSLIESLDINLFMVDYNKPAEIFYIRDQTIVEVGAVISNFIKSMINICGCNETQFVLIGFGMGAHVAGEIGRNLNGKIRAIVALDPADMTPPNVYIDSYKAEYVQVIHTSTKGLFTPLGHADYYPNTAEQPGCAGSSKCSHLRATQYYGESVTNGGFSAVICDGRKSFSLGLCDKNHLSYFGGKILDHMAKGTYFFDTRSKPPFSLS